MEPWKGDTKHMLRVNHSMEIVVSPFQGLNVFVCTFSHGGSRGLACAALRADKEEIIYECHRGLTWCALRTDKEDIVNFGKNMLEHKRVVL